MNSAAPESEQPRESCGWRPVLGAVGVLILGVVVLRVFDPATSLVYPPCPFHALTGCYCPGCGSTRALGAIARGEMVRAVRSNPLAVMMFPFLACAAWKCLCLSNRRDFVSRLLSSDTFAWLLFTIVILFWVLRNIPGYPFSLLAPVAE